MIRTQATQDLIAAGEQQLLIAETQEWAKPGVMPACIYSTGWQGTAWGVIMSTAMERKAVLKLAQMFSVLSIGAGGTATFGNDTAITAIGQAVTYQKAQGRPGPFLFAATSMGFADLMAWARTHQSDVAAAIGFIPAQNLEDIRANDRGGAAAALNAAYGGTYDNAVNGPTHNPLLYASQLNFPILTFYANDDAVAVPAAAQAFAAAAPNCQAINLGNSGGHAASSVDAAALRAELDSFVHARFIG